MAARARLGGPTEVPQAYGGEGPELRIRPSERERALAAVMAARALALISLVVGLILALLTGSWIWIVVVEAWAVVAGLTSYFGQAHNAVFVGEVGVRRISRGCAVVAPWPELTGLQVSIPGNRIVVFRLQASRLEIRQLNRGRSRAAKAMIRHMPEGLEMRLDRASADQLVAEVARRRPELPGLEGWAEASHLPGRSAPAPGDHAPGP